jgi:DNA-binding transcriptional MocR family regulator
MLNRRQLGIQLDPRRPEPLYRQVFDQVAERVRSGTFPAGYRLPPTRQLAVELGAHRNTVVRAYADLESSGFVVSTVGRGTFVARTVPDAPLRVPGDRPELPWASLVAPAALAEPLGRSNRLKRAAMRDDLIHLGRMHPADDLIPVDLFRRCVEHVLRTRGARALGYTPREGVPALRALIADDLARQGVPALPEDVIVTSGSQQAIDLVVRALVSPGERFLVDALTYPGAMNALVGAGASLCAVGNDDEGPSMASLARLGPGAKGYYAMPSGHNPTGITMSARRREALIDWSHQAGFPLVEDDFSADLSIEDEPPPPALRALDRQVIYVGSFSKKLIPALRLGFVVAPPALQPVLAALKQALDVGSSALMQYALAEFLERGYLRAHLGRILPEYRARRDALEAALRLHLPPDIQWRRSVGALHLWLPLANGYNPEEVADEARRRGVMVSPSTLYAVDPREQPGVRLTFCAEPVARLQEGARRLGKALSALAPRRPAAMRSHEQVEMV